MRSNHPLAVVPVAGVLAFAGLGLVTTPAAAADPEVMPSIVSVDLERHTATFPLHRGTGPAGAPVWYVVTETSDRDLAARWGVNSAPKLANALGTRAVQRARWRDGTLRFRGTVDFRPQHALEPGPSGFPPAVARPGSRGGPAYSPLVTTGDGVVINAEHVANRSGVHDKVVRIDRAQRRVTLRLTEGFARGDRVLYLSTDASDPVAATLEESTFVPRLGRSPGVAEDDPSTSARTGLVAVVNGVTDPGSPARQGLASAVLGQGDPLNILQWGPRAGQYSPLWDVHPAVWTDAAVSAGARERLDDFSEVANAVGHGELTSGGAGPANRRIDGLRAAEFVVNCPIVVVF